MAKDKKPISTFQDERKLDPDGSDSPGLLRISSDQMSQLLSLSKKARKENSPIPDDITQKPPEDSFVDLLLKSNWAKKKKLLVPAKKALDSLINPTTRIQLVLGSSKEISITHLFSDNGFQDNSLILYQYHRDEDIHVLRPGQSPSDISDALLSQLLNGPHIDGLQFSISLKNSELLTYLAALDLVYTRQLKARLDVSNFPVMSFNASDVLKRFLEIRMGEDLLWSSTLIPFLFPYLPQKLSEKEVINALIQLTELKYLTPVGKNIFQPSEFTTSLAESLHPIISFASCAVLSDKGEGFHLGFLIGLNVNLVITVEEEKNSQKLNLVGMDGIQLSRLLYEIGIPKEKSV